MRFPHDKSGRKLNSDPTQLIDWFENSYDGGGYKNNYGFLSNHYIDSPRAATPDYIDILRRAVGNQVEASGPLQFSNVETPFQAAKAQNIEDFWRIWNCDEPGAAKRQGRMCSLRHDWEEVKLYVMQECLRMKFPHDQAPLSKQLLATGSAYLCEGTFWGDTIWGVDLEHPMRPGDNWLGTLLMERRAYLAGGGTPLLPWNGRR